MARNKKEDMDTFAHVLFRKLFGRRIGQTNKKAAGNWGRLRPLNLFSSGC